MHLILIRHGQSEPNPATPDWSLSTRGAWEARRVGERLAGAGITHILSSPLLRALATAHIIAEVLDHPLVDVWVDLREGFDHDYASRIHPELLIQFPRAVWSENLPDDGWIFPGDTRSLFLSRCARMLDRLRARFGPEDRVAVVTHGGVAMYLLQAILQIPSGEPVWFEMANGAITTVRFVPEHERTAWPLYPAHAVEVLTMNDVSHLSGSPQLSKDNPR